MGADYQPDDTGADNEQSVIKHKVAPVTASGGQEHTVGQRDRDNAARRVAGEIDPHAEAAFLADKPGRHNLRCSR